MKQKCHCILTTDESVNGTAVTHHLVNLVHQEETVNPLIVTMIETETAIVTTEKAETEIEIATGIGTESAKEIGTGVGIKIGMVMMTNEEGALLTPPATEKVDIVGTEGVSVLVQGMQCPALRLAVVQAKLTPLWQLVVPL